MNQFSSLPAEMQAAMVEYAKANGRTWKQKLRDDRLSHRPKVEGVLRQFMNSYGGSVLSAIRLPADSNDCDCRRCNFPHKRVPACAIVG